MDVQLKELIETIKTEGVKEAEDQASHILKTAGDKGGEIIEQAKKEAAGIIAHAKAEAVKFEASGKEALKQASRDLLLKMESQVVKFFDSLVKDETRAAFSGKVLEEALVSLIKGWSEKDTADVTVLLPPSEYEKLESSLRSRLGDKLKEGVEIKPFPGIEAGFRISSKDNSSYYNFTSQGLAEMLSEFLNPRLSALMKEAVKE